MIFPVWGWHQEKMAQKLKAVVARTRPRASCMCSASPERPSITRLVLFGLSESEPSMNFAAYDPNIPDHPVTLGLRPETAAIYFCAQHLLGRRDFEHVMKRNLLRLALAVLGRILERGVHAASKVRCDKIVRLSIELPALKRAEAPCSVRKL